MFIFTEINYMSSGYGLTPFHLIHNSCSSHPKFTLKSKSGRNRNTPHNLFSENRANATSHKLFSENRANANLHALCRRCVGDIFCTVITKSVLRIMDSYILLLCHISFIIGHPSRVQPGKHFYTCAARTRHEINLRGASYKLVPEYFANSLLGLMTRPRRACAFAQSHQGPAAH